MHPSRDDRGPVQGGTRDRAAVVATTIVSIITTPLRWWLNVEPLSLRGTRTETASAQ